MTLSLTRTLLAASVLAVSSAWGQTDLQEGLWEVSVTMTVGGQATSAQPLVMRQCISQQSAQQVMSQLTGAGSCSTADLRQEGNRATWAVTCSSPVEMDASGTATFRSDSFDGSMDGQIGMGTQKVPFSQNFQARRVGPCK